MDFWLDIPGRFLDPLLFAIVFSAVILMAWIQNGSGSLSLAFAALAHCGLDPFDSPGENSTFMCRRIDFVLREDGWAGLDRLRSQDPFVGKVIAKLAAAQDSKCFEEWVRLESCRVTKRQNTPGLFWSAASEIAPAIGLIGTIIGLIQLFAKGIDPMAMGPAMSFTLLTSLYGLFISHIIAHPLHSRLAARADILNAYRSEVVEHVIAIARRDLKKDGPVHFSPAREKQATG